MKIIFLGATEEVTGSRYLIEQNNVFMLVDCGLFQGDKKLRARNWDSFPIDPKTIQAIVLTSCTHRSLRLHSLINKKWV